MELIKVITQWKFLISLSPVFVPLTANRFVDEKRDKKPLLIANSLFGKTSFQLFHQVAGKRNRLK